MSSLRFALAFVLVSTPAAAQITASAATGSVNAGYSGSRYRNILPHLAVGGYWQTRITIANYYGAPVTVPIRFFDPNGNSLSLQFQHDPIPLNYVEVYVPGYATRVIETADTGTQIKVGYAKADIPCPNTACDQVVVHSAFCLVNLPNSQDLEATVFPGDSRSAMVVMPFDNRNGFVTGVAIAAHECTGTDPRILLDFKYNDETSNTFYQQAVAMKCPGQTSFALPTIQPNSANRFGYIEIFGSSTGGTIKLTAIGLLFRPNNGAFSTIPVTDYLP